MAQIDLKQATIIVRDGSATPNELNIKIGEGNLTFTERRNMEYTLDRGLIDEVREGDQVPMEINIDFVWEYLSSPSGGDTPTIIEAIKGEGVASDWVSTDDDPCRPYAVDIVVTYNPECGTDSVETITLPDFRFEEVGHDLREGTMSCSGRCNSVQPLAVRNTAPTITDIEDQTIVQDTDTGALAFTIGDAQSDPDDLTVVGTSSDQTLVPNDNIVFAGTGENRTVTVTPAAGEFGVCTITISVSDDFVTTTETFTLTVTEA